MTRLEAISSLPIYVGCRSQNEVDAVIATQEAISEWAAKHRQDGQRMIAHLEFLEIEQAAMTDRLAQILAMEGRMWLLGAMQKMLPKEAEQPSADGMAMAISSYMEVLAYLYWDQFGGPKAKTTDEECRELAARIRMTGRLLLDQTALGYRPLDADTFTCGLVLRAAATLSDDILISLAYSTWDFDEDIVEKIQERDGYGEIAAEKEELLRKIPGCITNFDESVAGAGFDFLQGKPVVSALEFLRGFDGFAPVADELLYYLRTSRYIFRGMNDVPPPNKPKASPIVRSLWISELLHGLTWSQVERTVMIYLLEHPAKFTRFQGDGDAAAAKRVLRPLARYFVGLQSLEECQKLLCFLRDANITSDRIVMGVVALVEAAIALKPDLEAKIAPELSRHRSAFSESGAYVGSLLVPFNLGSIIRPDPIPSPVAAIEVQADTDGGPIISSPRLEFWGNRGRGRETVPVARPADSEPSKYRFHYLEKPESALGREFTVECSATDASTTLEELIETRSSGMAPPASLARAIIHFAFELDPVHRMTWNKEKVGPHTFHKLKRGSDRIYVRVDGTDVWLHIFQRRDWKKPIPLAHR